MRAAILGFLRRRDAVHGAGGDRSARDRLLGRRLSRHSEAVGKLTHVGRRNPERGAEVRAFPFPQTSASRELAETFRRTGYFNTFASSPLQGAVGKAVIHGLFVGVELVEDPATKAPDREATANVVNALKDRGFLTGSAGAHGNVLKLRRRSS